MTTQRVPLTRIDPAGASEGKVLKYSSGALAWEDDGGGGGGSGTAFKNTILGTESIEAASLEQYQVHSGLEILSGGTFTIAASGDLILDAPDDPNKAAGWTDMGAHIATTDTRDSVCIGTQTQLSTDDKLSVAGGNLTVAGSISAQSDVYGNARTMTNPGILVQRVYMKYEGPVIQTSTGGTYVGDGYFTGLSATITPKFSNSKLYISCKLPYFMRNSSESVWCGLGVTFGRYEGGSAVDNRDGTLTRVNTPPHDANGSYEEYCNVALYSTYDKMQEDDLSSSYSGTGTISYFLSAWPYGASTNLDFYWVGGSGGQSEGTLRIDEILQ